jgi:hypothetical protein
MTLTATILYQRQYAAMLETGQGRWRLVGEVHGAA